MSDGTIILGTAGSLVAFGFWLGRKSRQGTIDGLKRDSARLKESWSRFREQAESLIADLRVTEKRAHELERTNNELHEMYNAVLNNLRKDGALLPSAVRWADKLQESLDKIIVSHLELPPHPAPAAAAQVKEARALARKYKQDADLFCNQLDLYEAQAPWLVEYADYSIDEIIEGLEEEQKLQRIYASSGDPVRLFISSSDWSRLSESERNQLALDRYWEHLRSRSAWAAGIQYERFIGYLYEQDGYDVEYHGALKGKHDLGIDLICRKSDRVLAIQCKRLSVVKAIPVRENTIAQIYGASMFYGLQIGINPSGILPVIVTTYELSEEAMRFAKYLNVEVRQNVAFEGYPCIKCNIGKDGERIYHLPFDQQYDNTKIKSKGEFYAERVIEAEKAGFRRAFRWHG